MLCDLCRINEHINSIAPTFEGGFARQYYRTLPRVRHFLYFCTPCGEKVLDCQKFEKPDRDTREFIAQYDPVSRRRRLIEREIPLHLNISRIISSFIE